MLLRHQFPVISSVLTCLSALYKCTLYTPQPTQLNNLYSYSDLAPQRNSQAVFIWKMPFSPSCVYCTFISHNMMMMQILGHIPTPDCHLQKQTCWGGLCLWKWKLALADCFWEKCSSREGKTLKRCFYSSYFSLQEAPMRELSTLLSTLGGTISLYSGLSLYSSVEIVKIVFFRLYKIK